VDVVWSRAAMRQLQDIGAYIAQDSRDAAERVVDRIYAADDLRGTQPGLGEATDVANVRSWKIPGVPYRLFYRVRARADRVTILRVVHCRQLRTLPLR